jgi:putative transposase
MRTTYASDLTDEQWSIVEPHIPPSKPGGRARQIDIRRVVNAILYRTKAGCQWRMLPKDFPPWQTVYYDFGRTEEN